MQKVVLYVLVILFTHCLSNEINYQSVQKPSFINDFTSQPLPSQQLPHCDAYKHRNNNFYAHTNLSSPELLPKNELI